ncbi:putative GABA permease [Metarhizium anisopliae]|nr:putative GABA permease [Metarhizium anisopliae]
MSDTDKLKGTTSLDLESSTTNEDRGTQIKKRFNFWTAVGIAVCTSGAWEGWTASIAQGLLGGGSVGLLWGWVFVSVGILCMGLALADMWPLAGGQYVWAAKLAPPQLARLLSWFTAWAALAGMWLGTLSCGIGVSLQIQSYAVISRGYVPETWHTFLMCVACCGLWIVINIWAVDMLHQINTWVLVIHVTGYFVLIGVLLGCSSNKHDAKFVFTDFQNHTGWDSNFVSWSVGLLAALYAFFSLDSASHFSEEIPRANVLVPRAMCLQVVGNSLMTFPFIIVVLFCIGDIDAVLQSPIGLMSPFTQIIVNSTNSIPAGIILNLISTLVAFVAGCDLTGAVARAIWSMARDKALPQFLAKLEPRRNVPVWGNLVLVLPSILVYMIYIWNTTAFYGIMAGVLVAFQLSYIIPIGLYIVYAAWKKDLIKGPFNLGRLSYPCHVVAFIFGCFMTIVMSFPVYQPVTAANMNYASILVGAVLILSLCSWFTWGNKHYQGPLENSVHAEDDEDSIHAYPA